MVYKQFVNDQVLDADTINTYLMNQANIRVDTVAARDALPVKTKGMRVTVDANGITYLYTGSAWRAWESDWFDQKIQVVGLNGVDTPAAGGPNTGWVYNYSKVQYVAGRFGFKFELYLVGSSPGAFQQINISLPVAAAQGIQPLISASGTYTGDNSVYPIFGQIGGAGNNILYTTCLSGNKFTGTTYNQPFTWHVNDLLRMNVLYDVAV